MAFTCIVDGLQVIEEGNGMRLSFWRAPTDNDLGGAEIFVGQMMKKALTIIDEQQVCVCVCAIVLGYLGSPSIGLTHSRAVLHTMSCLLQVSFVTQWRWAGLDKLSTRMVDLASAKGKDGVRLVYPSGLLFSVLCTCRAEKPL